MMILLRNSYDTPDILMSTETGMTHTPPVHTLALTHVGICTLFNCRN